MNKKLKKIEEKVLEEPISRLLYFSELIHTLPSHTLLMLKKSVDMEIKDREYLYKDKKHGWMWRMFRKMELGI